MIEVWALLRPKQLKRVEKLFPRAEGIHLPPSVYTYVILKNPQQTCNHKQK